MVSSINQINITASTVNISVCNGTGRLTNLLIAKFDPYVVITRTGNFTGCTVISLPNDLFTNGVEYHIWLRDAETDLTVVDPDTVTTYFTYTIPSAASSSTAILVGIGLAAVVGYYLLTKK